MLFFLNNQQVAGEEFSPGQVGLFVNIGDDIIDVAHQDELGLVQRQHAFGVGAPEAALIMSLEAVFAALAGAALLSEQFTPAAVLGCVLILLSVALVEVGPIMKIHGMARALKNLLGPRH